MGVVGVIGVAEPPAVLRSARRRLLLSRLSIHDGKRELAMIDQPRLALSVKQPFAELIMAGRKRIEYRSRVTHVRGLIYIYSSQGRYRRQDERDLAEEFGLDVGTLPRGVILGTVELHGCTLGDDAWEWLVRNPVRAEVQQKPTRHPMPTWFRPW